MTERSDTDNETASRGTHGRHRSRSARLYAVVGLTAAGGLAAGGLVMGGVAGASAAGSTHTARSSIVATATHHRRGRGPLLEHLLRGTIHASFVLRKKTGTTETLVFDRGVVSSVSSTSIEIVPADTPKGTVSATITSTTRFRGLPESQLKSGDRVALLVQGADAVMVGSRPATGVTAPPSTAGSSTAS